MWIIVEGGVYDVCVRSRLLVQMQLTLTCSEGPAAQSSSTTTPVRLVSLDSPRHLAHVARFLRTGGKKILINQGGKDATEKFWSFHSKSVLEKTAKPFLIGRVGDEANQGTDVEEAVENKVEEDAPAQVEEEEDTTYFGGEFPLLLVWIGLMLTLRPP